MRIAICGKRKLGKSTLAKYMVEQYGWYHIDYVGILKEWMVDAINERRELIGLPYLSVEEVEKDKEKYRPLLQILGVEFGFDQGNGVGEALVRWRKGREERTQPVIFDNVRFQAQFDRLKDYGFVLVKLVGPRENELLRREDFVALGDNYMRRPREVDMHPAENQELRADIEISANNTLEDLADILLRLSGKVKVSQYATAA
jgi:hypothetical protein